MNLFERLNESVELLKESGIEFALAGGLVASLYRKTPRATADIDLVILSRDEKKASGLLKQLGLDPHPLRKADLEGGPMFAIKKKSTPVYIVCGRGEANAIGVDLLLATLPWAETALERALSNQIDFGSGPIPCLTLEDLILAKLYSTGNQAQRFMDLDDLQSIFRSGQSLDEPYLAEQIRILELGIPEPLLASTPKNLLSLLGKRPR